MSSNELQPENSELRTTEVRLRRPLPEGNCSPDSQPHILTVPQSTNALYCSIESEEIKIEDSRQHQHDLTRHVQPSGETGVLQLPSNSDQYFRGEPITVAKSEEICFQDGGEGDNEIMLLQSPEQMETYHRLLIVRNRVGTNGELSALPSTESRELTLLTHSNAAQYVPPNVISDSQEKTTEYKELNNATLRKYYGDVTPFGTVARVQRSTTNMNTSPNISNLEISVSNDDDTTRSISPMRSSSVIGSTRPAEGYGTILRRGKGGFYTTQLGEESNMENISYMDFLPRRLKNNQTFSMSRNFENFQNCIQEANKFLEQNPAVAIKTCESLYQRLDHSHRINPESTTSHDRSYVIGLRLWYFIEEDRTKSVPDKKSSKSNEVANPNEDESQTSQKRPRLCYKNFIPDYKEKSRPNDKPRKHRECPEFENMKFTIEKLNEDLLKTPLPGRLVSVETIPINYSNAFCGNGELDPDIGYWCLDFQGHWNVMIVRLFYIDEGLTTDMHEIGFEDFAPAPSKVTSSPEFQGFQSLNTSASRWFARDTNQHLNIIGSQAIELPFRLKKMVACKGKIDTYRSCYEPSKISAYWNTLRILRVWYVCLRQTTCSSRPVNTTVWDHASGTLARRDVRSGPGISVRTFAPCEITTAGCCGLRKPMFATTNDTVARINEWITLTGADVIAVQTDNVEKWRGKRCEVGRQLENRTYNKQDFPSSVGASSLEYRLTLFRVFVRSDSQGGHPEPDAKDFPPCPAAVEPCCCFVGCTIM